MRGIRTPNIQSLPRQPPPCIKDILASDHEARRDTYGILGFQNLVRIAAAVISVAAVGGQKIGLL